MITAYAGIGSRTITKEERETIIKIANFLSELGYVCYSGNAVGSDDAFQEGSNKRCVSYVPWNGFNAHLTSSEIHCPYINTAGFQSVDKFHPAPEKLNDKARRLMARNYHQVMGIFGYPPVDFIVCCATPKGDFCDGGTAQALRIANHFNIPWINIRTENWKSELKMVIRKIDQPANMEEIKNAINIY